MAGSLATTLRGARPGLKVLFMSGYATDASFECGTRQTAVGFIAKPFNPQHLLDKIRETLDDGPGSAGPA